MARRKGRRNRAARTTRVQLPHPIVVQTWEVLRDTGQWPTAECAARWFSATKLPRERYEIQKAVPGLQVYEDHVALAPRAAFGIPEVRHLLRNVPRLLRRASKLYVEEFSSQPFYWFNGTPDQRWIPDAFFTDATDSVDEAQQLARVLASLNIEPFRHSHAHSDGRRTFRLDLEILRFERVNSLEDWLSLHEERPTFSLDLYVKMVDRIAAHCEKYGDWPAWTRFAVDSRDLGFVPDLIASGDFKVLDTNWKHNERSKLELRFWALPLLTRRREIERTLDAVFPVLLERWQAGASTVGVWEIAQAIGQPVFRVGFVLRLLEHQTRLQIRIHDGDPANWIVTLGTHTREIEDWDRSAARLLSMKEAERLEEERRAREGRAAEHALYQDQLEAIERGKREERGRVAREALREEYDRLLAGRGMTPQARGQRFDGFLAELLISYGLESDSSIPTEHGELDVSVRFGERWLIGQAKWENKPINADPILVLRGRLEPRLGVTGFVVSMTGYTSPALSTAGTGVPKILLFGRPHVEALLEERLTAQQLFDRALHLAAVRVMYAPSIEQILGDRPAAGGRKALKKRKTKKPKTKKRKTKSRK